MNWPHTIPNAFDWRNHVDALTAGYQEDDDEGGGAEPAPPTSRICQARPQRRREQAVLRDKARFDQLRRSLDGKGLFAIRDLSGMMGVTRQSAIRYIDQWIDEGRVAVHREARSRQPKIFRITSSN